MTIKQFYNSLLEKLQTIYPQEEASQMVYNVLEAYVGVTKIDIALDANAVVESSKIELVDSAISRLLNHEPLQYVLGEADFYDLVFKVSSDVLIPRPETEELVRLILDMNTEASLSLLEIGTGSGCIPITLKKHMSSAQVSACDISDAALDIARGNAERNDTEVNFFHCDILDQTQWNKERYDIIVSNPPYVLNSEKELMRENVLDFEPHLALFVEDDDPLLFYRTIADFALTHLNTKGKLYFEMNEAFGAETGLMLEQRGFCNIVIHQDIFGKERMLSASI